MTGVELSAEERAKWRADAKDDLRMMISSAGALSCRQILTLLDALDAAEARAAQAEALVEAGLGLADDPETWVTVEGGQPNGVGTIEPSDNREWYTDARESHHRHTVTLYGPWQDGPSKGVVEVNILRDALGGAK